MAHIFKQPQLFTQKVAEIVEKKRQLYHLHTASQSLYAVDVNVGSSVSENYRNCQTQWKEFYHRTSTSDGYVN